MKRTKNAWIPIAVLLLPALLFLFFTLWMGAAEYSGATGEFVGKADLSGFWDRLTEAAFLTALWHSLLLRLGSLAAGCAAGWLLGAGVRRIPSPTVRSLIVVLFLLPAFVPVRILTAYPPLSLIPSLPLRYGAALALPVLSLSLFCAAAFRERLKHTAALLPLAAGAVFVLSVDPDAALAAGNGFTTLDAWSVSLMKTNGSYTFSAQVSAIKIVFECIAALIPALILGRLTAGKAPAPASRGSAAGALWCTVLALCLSAALLLPSLLTGSPVKDLTSDAFLNSAAAAGLAMLLALIVCAALLLTMPFGRGMMAVLSAALVMLSALSAAKFALADQAAVPAPVTCAFFAAFSPLTLSLLLCLIALAPGGVWPRLRGALALAALSGARASFSCLPGEVLDAPALGSFSLPPEGPALFALLLCPLFLYVLAAPMLSVFTCPAKKAASDSPADHVILAQGWSSRGGKGAASVLPAASLPGERAEEAASAPVVTAAVPAKSDYTAQYVRAQTPHEVAPAIPVPAEEPQSAAPADADPYSRPSDLTIPEESFSPAVTPREEEIPEDAPPSPAQIVSMINALTRMRAIGVMTDEEYREKYDRLMKLL